MATTKRLVFTLLPGFFAVCRLKPGDGVPAWVGNGSFTSVTRTSDELSIVCAESSLPAGSEAEKGWRCLKVQGPFSFSVTGVVAAFASILAREEITIFVVSTYDTDYLLVSSAMLEKTVLTLSNEGHQVLLEG